jgi:hypothetical protein
MELPQTKTANSNFGTNKKASSTASKQCKQQPTVNKNNKRMIQAHHMQMLGYVYIVSDQFLFRSRKATAQV